jgi:hypothetical protein
MRRLFLSALACLALVASSANAEVADEVRRSREQSVLLVGADARAMLAREWTKYDPRTLERREDALHRVRELGKRLAIVRLDRRPAPQAFRPAVLVAAVVLQRWAEGSDLADRRATNVAGRPVGAPVGTTVVGSAKQGRPTAPRFH